MHRVLSSYRLMLLMRLIPVHLKLLTFECLILKAFFARIALHKLHLVISITRLLRDKLPDAMFIYHRVYATITPVNTLSRFYTCVLSLDVNRGPVTLRTKRATVDSSDSLGADERGF